MLAFVLPSPCHHHHHHHVTTPPRRAVFLEGGVQEAVAEATIRTISLFGGGVLFFAAILTLVNITLVYANAFFQKEVFEQFMPFDRAIGAGTATITRVRLQLAQLIALGLEILLCGDILETLVKSTKDYSIDALYKLALVAAIRTVLSYFLGRETGEILERAKSDRRVDGIAIDDYLFMTDDDDQGD
ncbi:hypothetical protein CTAYLR_003349 [Chrysophaeum taylorii]|uniref:DUF1622 domain-containing protein n=1 Tax=Chrysophaeum taylorii TaxID=2483200 RepID=A0AAD7XM93_9STRA|nr:hypothetical protein CTAYLR_003349 [Chrysophaeum taylorii]